jgi:hypothetical protein
MRDGAQHAQTVRRLNMMSRSFVRRGLAVAMLLTLGAGVPAALDARGSHGAAGSVKVTVNYSGKGDVNDSHRLWVWLFDSPNIGAGSIPIDEMSLDTNGGTATFDAVAAGEVWIAVAYDVNGNFGGSAPPPSGSPVATYGMAKGAPASVTPGEKGAVTFTFGDSVRMP